ncbi:cyclic pyranopterin monophosphate synthase MoaC [Halorubellus sp. PRR65]|uniref:cyclic pyranopterin monophosphate synthase MoaC n=1 Tax=Halorubellus sp. PRR65 TaxID=3098148 RepID=UPI002B256920|nr:cyclic pyranopterin monophosphate synthase MoaC [Halorubellus sp. PRR65]
MPEGDDGDRRDADAPAPDADSEDLTHVSDGEASMVDVGSKPETARRAVARGRLALSPASIAAIRADDVEKGDVLATARVGAIQAVKHTWETIPLCHQIPVTNVDVDFAVDDDAVALSVAVETTGKTGCEMEALEGVTTGLNVVFDMVKAVEKDDDGEYPTACVEDVRVVEKTKRSLAD